MYIYYMPYIIVKSGKGFKVKKQGENKYFSKKPLTLIKAQKQKKAIIINELFKK